MDWRIESRQKSVAGVGGHNYLARIDPSGRIVEEIHGAPGGNNRLVYATGLREPEVDGAGRVVISGTEADIDATWKQMIRHAEDLNGKAVYGLLSPNSNAFWGTVLRLSGFDHRQHEPNSDLLTPGTGVDLSDPRWWTPEHRWPGVPVPASAIRPRPCQPTGGPDRGAGTDDRHS
jgi:hypothetical protein